jgi:hypothetical protein
VKFILNLNLTPVSFGNGNPQPKDGFPMRKKPNRIFLIIAISSCLLFSPLVDNCKERLETTLIPTDLNFESFDQDDSSDSQRPASRSPLSMIFLGFFLAETTFPRHSDYLRSPLHCLEEKASSILRC